MFVWSPMDRSEADKWLRMISLPLSEPRLLSLASQEQRDVCTVRRRRTTVIG